LRVAERCGQQAPIGALHARCLPELVTAWRETNRERCNRWNLTWSTTPNVSCAGPLTVLADWRMSYNEAMIATEFEFKNRFWLIGIIFAVSFQLFAIDHMPMDRWLAQLALGPMSPYHEPGTRAVLALGALLTLLAAILRTWAAAYLDSDVVHDRALHSHALVSDGPYRYLRNPLYLGTILIALGLGLTASRLGFGLLVGAITAFTLRLIGREELLLERDRGESYLQYRRRVPSMIPSIGARFPGGRTTARWGQAFAGELFAWSFFAGMALYTCTQHQVALWTPVVIGVLIAAARMVRRGRAVR
jgi:protein-S-isoprenylcysteine O-methyltransferase Ste14